jgi:hypothetical protein
LQRNFLFASFDPYRAANSALSAEIVNLCEQRHDRRLIPDRRVPGVAKVVPLVGHEPTFTSMISGLSLASLKSSTPGVALVGAIGKLKTGHFLTSANDRQEIVKGESTKK